MEEKVDDVTMEEEKAGDVIMEEEKVDDVTMEGEKAGDVIMEEEKVHEVTMEEEKTHDISVKIRRYRRSRTTQPQLVTTFKCRYCTRRFLNLTRYNLHLKNHQKRYRKFWWKERDEAEKGGNDNAVEPDQTEDSQSEDKDEEEALMGKGSEVEYSHDKDRVFVYLVYPQGSLCECNKENTAAKPLCKCDFTYKQLVYTSIQQMHEGLRNGIGYSCKQCKQHVTSESVNSSVNLNKENQTKITVYNQDDPEEQVIEIMEVSNGKWKCLECPSRFRCRDDQGLHMRLAHNRKAKTSRKTWKCLICNIVLPTGDRWKGHSRTHKERQIDVCKDCGTIFNTKENYETHMKDTHNIGSDILSTSVINVDTTKFFCSKCEDSFSKIEHYRRHQRVCCGPFTSNSGDEAGSNVKGAARALQCTICGSLYPDMEKLEEHIRHHIRLKDKSRAIGKKKKKKRSGYQDKINRIKMVSAQTTPNFPIINVCQTCKTAPCCCKDGQGNVVTSFVPIAPKPQVKCVLVYQCMNCSLKFVSMAGLETHKKLCQGDKLAKKDAPAWKKATSSKVIKKPWKTWRCDECLQVFRNRDDLRLHVRQVHKKGQLFRGKVWQCDICKEILSSRDKWKQHNIRVHKGKFKCQECTFSFACQEDLNIHITKRHDRQTQDYVDVPFSAFDGEKGEGIMDLSDMQEDGLLDQNLKEVLEEPACDPEGKWNCTEGDCMSRFKIRDDLKLHVRLSHKGGKVRGKIWQCQICKIVLPTCDRWKRHGQKHKAEENRGACQPCGIYFISRADFDSHVRQFHENLVPDFLDETSYDGIEAGSLSSSVGEPRSAGVYEEMCEATLQEIFEEPKLCQNGKWQCGECPNRYMTRDDMKLHVRIRHRQGERLRGKLWQCRICQIALPSRDKWQGHGRSKHKGVDLRACRDCGVFFQGDANYAVHMMQVHRKDLATVEVEEKQRQSMPSSRASNHGNESSTEWWPCNKCPRIADSFAALKKHCNEKHQDSQIYVEECWPCFECASMFQNITELRSHVTVVHPDSIGRDWPCKVCSAIFQRSDDLQEHRKKHHEDPDNPDEGTNRWVCPDCGEILSTRDEMRFHRKSHSSSESTFKCNQCGWVFPDHENMQEHIKDHKIDFEHLKCLECNTDYPSHTDLKNHLETHFDMCQLCGFKFSPMTDREKHIRICAIEGPRSDSTECSECGEKFDKPLQLRLHIANHAVKREQTRCKVCGVQFQRLKEMKMHRETHKTDCLICGQKFMTVEQLNEHLDKHLACKHCLKIFESHNSLRRHLNTFCPVLLESGGKGGTKSKFPTIPGRVSTMKKLTKSVIEVKCECFCDQCGRKFTTKGALKHHRVIHFRKKFKNPTKCPDCDSTFLYATQLRLHQKKVHWPEKPFPCMYCRGKKRFKTNEELQRHEQIHTAGKKYKCPMCTRRFGDATGLKYHLNIHTGVKPYKCQYCPKTFNQPGQCKTHERLHEGKKPYKCHLCTCAYTYGMSLKIHLQTHIDRGELDKLPEIIHSEELQAQKKARNEALKKSKRENARQRTSREENKDMPFMEVIDIPNPTHQNIQPQGQNQQHQSEEEQVFEAVAAAVMATEHTDTWNQGAQPHPQPNQWHVSVIGDPMAQQQHNVMQVQQRPMAHHPMHVQHQRQVEESAAADALFNMIHHIKPN